MSYFPDEDSDHHIDVFVARYYDFSKPIIDLVALKRTGDAVYHRNLDGSEYYGQMVNGIRHGQGLWVKGKRIYCGQWQNDLRHGKGKERFDKKISYEGSFVNGKFEGHGTYVWEDGSFYTGEWSSGVRHGQGLWKSGKGQSSYKGEWRFGEADGYGVQISKEGDRYEGEFRKNMKNGLGTEHFHNKDSYKGEYVNGKPEGNGRYIWARGNFYEGQFRNGLRHGQGFWSEQSPDSKEPGATYRGQYVNDQKCGQGVYKWKSGNFYRGGFFNDQRQGQGEMYWQDGSYYKGQWVQGMQNGEGELVFQQQFTKKTGVQRGLFKNNLLIADSVDHDPKVVAPRFELSKYQIRSEPSPDPHALQLNSATQTTPTPIKPIKFTETNENNHLKIPKITVYHRTIESKHNISIPVSEQQLSEMLQASRYFRSQIAEEGGDVRQYLNRHQLPAAPTKSVRYEKQVHLNRSQSVSGSKGARYQFLPSVEREPKQSKLWIPAGLVRPRMN